MKHFTSSQRFQKRREFRTVRSFDHHYETAKFAMATLAGERAQKLANEFEISVRRVNWLLNRFQQNTI